MLWDSLSLAADAAHRVDASGGLAKSPPVVPESDAAQVGVARHTQVAQPCEKCGICLYPLDLEHDVLTRDEQVKYTRLESVARELRDKEPQVAYRRVKLDCGGSHEFCYVCAVLHYLHKGNTCPLCRSRFTRIAHRAVADRDRTEALSRRPRGLPALSVVAL